MKLKKTVVEAKEEHKVLYHELITLVRRHGDTVTAPEMLAIAANMVGKLIALQDQQTMSQQRAMQIVATNIERGNDEAVRELMKTQGSA